MLTRSTCAFTLLALIIRPGWAYRSCSITIERGHKHTNGSHPAAEDGVGAPVEQRAPRVVYICYFSFPTHAPRCFLRSPHNSPIYSRYAEDVSGLPPLSGVYPDTFHYPRSSMLLVNVNISQRPVTSI